MLFSDVLKLFLQLIILGIIGGGVTFYYNKLQKNREILFNILNQVSTIHMEFIALRYKYNVLFTEVGKPIKGILSQEEVDRLKWKYYEEACLLLSKYQSLKPLIVKHIPKLEKEATSIDAHYQNYRRTIRANQPIYQSEEGKSGSGLGKLKNLHQQVLSALADKL